MILRSQAGRRLTCLRPRLGVWIILVPLLAYPLFADESAISAPKIYPQGILSLASLANQMDVAAGPELISAAVAETKPSPAPISAPVAPEISELPVPAPADLPTIIPPPPANGIPTRIAEILSATNDVSAESMSDSELAAHLQRRLETARYHRASRQANEAEAILVELMSPRTPESLKQLAMLELAAVAQDQNDLTRAQQIYAQFLSKWTGDLRVPEILLRQGQLYRRMGLYNMAFTKFYAVMTSALALKNDQFDYYVRLVQDAQLQIAETHYELGKYAEAADFLSRLLKQNSPTLDKPQLLYQLTRCYTALRKFPEAVANAQDFLIRFPGAPEQPEIRFHLAVALKELGRNNESLNQVLRLLQEQRDQTRNRPEVWAYWQQRTGNLIANQLFREGDYTKALEIYLDLSGLDPSPSWQVPLNYQIGMTYERLWQPQKATQIYTEILSHEKNLGTNAAPGMRAVLDMARWRIRFIEWQNKAEAANRQLHLAATNTAVTASLPTRLNIP